MKKIQKIASLAALYVASFFANPATAQEVEQPEEPEAPKWSMYNFTEANTETGDFFSKLKVFYDSKVTLAVAHAKDVRTDMSSRWIVPDTDLDVFLDLYGNVRNEDGFGLGLNTRVQGEHLRAGLTGELAETEQLDHMLSGYAGLDAGNFTLDIGLAHLQQQGENRTAVHGTTFFDAQRETYTLIVGGGGLVDSKGNIYIHGVGGHFPNQKGKGTGSRFSVQSHLEGDVHLEGVLAWGANMGVGYFRGDHGITEGLHEGDLRLVPNPIDRAPNATFSQWASLGAIGARYHQDTTGQGMLSLEGSVDPFAIAREMAGAEDRYGIGAAFGAQVDVVQGNSLWTGKLDLTKELKPGSYLLLSGSKTEGQKPSIILELSLDF